MAYWINSLLSNQTVSSTPGNQVVDGEKQLLQVVFDLDKHALAYFPPPSSKQA